MISTRALRIHIFGVTAGVLNHVFFLMTVYFLYGFLHGNTERPGHQALLVDLGLTLQFAVSHSWLLLPSVRKRIAERIPSAFFGTLFCSATCASLLLTIGHWQTSSIVLLDLAGTSRAIVEWAFIATWGVLLYSLSLSGLGSQTGLTTWWAWVRQQPLPKRDFNPRGLYQFFRHPIYASFLGLLWITPTITLDRLLLNIVWTGYIFVGSTLKDRRLEHFIGDRYLAYETKVVGYPGMFAGPLAKRPKRIAA